MRANFSTESISSLRVVVESDYGPIVVNRLDSHIGRSIVQHGYWMQEEVHRMLALIERLLATAPLIRSYDVGANIGTHTLAIAKTFGSRVAVRAFEAQDEMFRMLCQTVEINGLQQVSCHHNAVAEVSGITLSFATPDYDQANNFGSLELMSCVGSDNRSLSRRGRSLVDTVSIDSFHEHVDFIKLDIEGMEDCALHGATRTFERSRPVCMIEIHKTDREFVIDFLKRQDYVWALENANLFAVPSERRDLLASTGGTV